MMPSPPLAPLAFTIDPIGGSNASIDQQTIHALRRAILNFQLKPGQRHVEREPIERLSVSRTTPREALRELAAEHLVTVVPQKDARVQVPSYEDATDHYELRAALEALVVTRLVARASDKEIEALRAAVEGYRAVANRTDIIDLSGAKKSFYEMLIYGPRSNALQQLLDGIKVRVQTR